MDEDTRLNQDQEEQADVASKPDSEKTIDEIKAEAEALEKQYKLERDSNKDDEIRQNQLRRLEKAREKVARISDMRQEAVKPDEPSIDTRDLITLATEKIAEGSDKAKILEKYKAGGIITSFAEGLAHPGVMAEFARLDEANNAAAVVDESDTQEGQMRTKQEIINSYRASGEVPEDAKAQQAIVEDSLKRMNI